MKKLINSNIFFYLFIFIIISLIAFYSIKLLNIKKDNDKNQEIKIETLESVNIVDKETTSNNIGYQGDEDNIKKENYIPIFMTEDENPKSNIEVDFNQLKEKNKEIMGWIYIPDTNVNYALTQTDNNDFYLKHNLNKDYNAAGWIYADFRSNLLNLKNNTVIYGHNQTDLSMFGSLKKLKTKDWFNSEERKYIYLETEELSYVFKIFSVYVSDANSYYIKHSFNNDEYIEFINNINNENIVNSLKDNANISDKILTLSTCENKNRLVVHGKLIRIIEKRP